MPAIRFLMTFCVMNALKLVKHQMADDTNEIKNPIMYCASSSSPLVLTFHKIQVEINVTRTEVLGKTKP